MLNIGLITPQQILTKILHFYENNKKTTSLSSIEGFIRQIIGWREYMRMIYMFSHKELIKMNHFNHQKSLSKEWYTGDTQIIVIDNLINKVIKYGYAHHIERLMYLGNFMLLNEIKPSDTYKWFMVFFIDSYNWVMEPNVYGMSQYSAGHLMSTRPYFSSSNYINKMSNYKKNNKDITHEKIKLNNKEYNWYEIWDALYYNFINNHKKEFSFNYSLANSVANWNKKNHKEQQELLYISKMWLKIY